MICDISINSLDYESNIILKIFFNCLFLRLKTYFPTAIGKHCILNIIQMLLILNSQSSLVEEYDTEYQKKVEKKNTFKPIGNQEYSEVLEKEANCEKNPRKKGLNDSEKTSLKKLKTLPRNCTIKINLQNTKII